MRSVLVAFVCIAGCDSPAEQPALPAPESRPPASVAASAPPPPPADPLFPSRPPRSVVGPGSDPDAARDAASRKAGRVAAWPRQRPARDLQYSRTAAERGVLPCEAPDPGFGVHDDWIHVRPMGQFVAPRAGALDSDGSFDLVVHFHGHRPARKEFARSGEDLVLLGVSLGIGVAYGPDFADPKVFEKLVAAVERKLSQREKRPARARRIALSSWSRGFEAIAAILRQPIAARVDAVILLDSLHASRDPGRGPEQLAPFVDFARRAAREEALMVVTHSAIDTEPYASSSETAHYLTAAIGGAPAPASREDPLGLELVDLHSKGAYFERGYAGNGKLDHCAHFGVYAAAIQALARRWKLKGS